MEICIYRVEQREELLNCQMTDYLCLLEKKPTPDGKMVTQQELLSIPTILLLQVLYPLECVLHHLMMLLFVIEEDGKMESTRVIGGYKP